MTTTRARKDHSAEAEAEAEGDQADRQPLPQPPGAADQVATDREGAATEALTRGAYADFQTAKSAQDRPVPQDLPPLLPPVVTR